MGEQREMELKVEQLVVDVEEKQLETDSKSPVESTVDCGDNVRSWFVQLTEQERMVALSFSDDLFIDAMLKVASSSSWTSIAALPAHAVLGPQGLEWERMFMIKEFAKLYEAFKEKTNMEVATASESVDTTDPSIPSESKTIEDEMAMEQPSITEECAYERNTTSEELDVDDAFRIHRSVDICEGQNAELEKSLVIANGKKAAALALSSIAKRNNSASFEASPADDVVKNCQLVFPSVVEFAQGSTSTDVQAPPMIILSPSFLEKTKTDELLAVFDAVLTKGGRAHFLSDSVFPDIQKSENSANNWLLRICGNRGDESMEKVATSLSLLLVARFEHAVFEAYAGRAQRSRRTMVDSQINEDVEDAESKPVSSLPEEAEGSNSDQWATAPEEESSDDQNADERSLECPNAHGETSTSEYFDADSSADKASKEHGVNAKVSPVCYFEMKGPTLLSQKAVVNSLSASIRMFDVTYPNGNLKVAMSPIVNIMGVHGTVDASQLRASNLMMTPLIWFLRFGDGTHMDVKTICKAIENSLKSFTDCSDSSKCIEFPAMNASLSSCVVVKSMVPTETADSEVAGEIHHTAIPEEVCDDNIDASSSTKKLKKKKKKKKRKSMNADAETPSTNDQLVQPSDPGGHEQFEKLTMSKLGEAASSDTTSHNASTSSASQSCSVAVVPNREAENPVLAGDTVSEQDNPPNSQEKSPYSDIDSGKGPHDSVMCVDAQNLNDNSEVDDQMESEVDHQDETVTDDGSAWETVETRTRTSRKKSGDRGHFGSGRSGSYNHSYSYNGMNSSFSKKSKGARTAASRKRNTNRKMVREILTSVLDAVDEELARRAKPAQRLAPLNKSVLVSPGPAVMQRVENKKPVTLRDLFIGIATESSQSNQKPAPLPSDTNSPRPINGLRKLSAKNADTKPEEVIDLRCEPALEKSRRNNKTVADQNTAPTVPETMSAVSANSMNTNGLFGAGSLRRRSETGIDLDAARSDSSCEELIETEKDLQISCSTTDDKQSSPAPPLPTLLSPGNADSASSSVASSLEVPHGHHHHRSYSATENVGYHLLDVCDRLTRDMNVFMDRRGLALNVRRRERGELLTALQDTLTKLWPGRCNVNMYGSCATQLDLPSSDLDVVVCGLDRKGESLPSAIKTNNKKSGRRGNAGSTESDAVEFNPQSDLPAQYLHAQTGMQQFSPFLPFNPVQINGERVIRLAAELERQPWAVHVKAVPTATVPVVKILADPAKLPGAKAAGAAASDWMSHHQHMAAIAAGISSAGVSSSGPHFYPLHNPLPWRGADVMNGLMSVDITFEGPEHGGIGSTKLSSRIVKEACEEYSCSPERVPLVQVLMVLKEMLAQRRLNEPFSGGLSSYALLLLVEALVKERAVIREELERVERQRRVVAAGGGNASLEEHHSRRGKVDKESSRISKRDPTPSDTDGRPSSSSSSKNKVDVQNMPVGPFSMTAEGSLNPSNSKVQPTFQKKSSASSWASVAKKNTNASQKVVSELPRSEDPVPVVQPSSGNNGNNQAKPKATTFADAVARSVEANKPSVVADGNRPTRAESRVYTMSKNNMSNSSSAPFQSSSANTKNEQKEGRLAGNQENLARLPSPEEASGRKPQAPIRLNSSTVSIDSALLGPPRLFPQGSNDVVEVLCSGDTTAGKLLMHFLLFYGQHFDARTSAIDVSGKHLDVNRSSSRTTPRVPVSPYIQRRPGGTIDPVSGMLTVDPIVVYDPLEGSESNNVARSCFLWSNIRWVFAQSYNTLSSAVERSPTPPNTPGRQQQQQKVSTTKVSVTQETLARLGSNKKGNEMTSWQTPFVRDEEGQPSVDSPLLELLLSF